MDVVLKHVVPTEPGMQAEMQKQAAKPHVGSSASNPPLEGLTDSDSEPEDDAAAVATHRAANAARHASARAREMVRMAADTDATGSYNGRRVKEGAVRRHLDKHTLERVVTKPAAWASKSASRAAESARARAEFAAISAQVAKAKVALRCAEEEKARAATIASLAAASPDDAPALACNSEKHARHVEKEMPRRLRRWHDGKERDPGTMGAVATNARLPHGGLDQHKRFCDWQSGATGLNFPTDNEKRECIMDELLFLRDKLSEPALLNTFFRYFPEGKYTPSACDVKELLLALYRMAQVQGCASAAGIRTHNILPPTLHVVPDVNYRSLTPPNGPSTPSWAYKDKEPHRHRPAFLPEGSDQCLHPVPRRPPAIQFRTIEPPPHSRSSRKPPPSPMSPCGPSPPPYAPTSPPRTWGGPPALHRARSVTTQREAAIKQGSQGPLRLALAAETDLEQAASTAERKGALSQCTVDSFFYKKKEPKPDVLAQGAVQANRQGFAEKMNMDVPSSPSDDEDNEPFSGSDDEDNVPAPRLQQNLTITIPPAAPSAPTHAQPRGTHAEPHAAASPDAAQSGRDATPPPQAPPADTEQPKQQSPVHAEDESLTCGAEPEGGSTQAQAGERPDSEAAAAASNGAVTRSKAKLKGFFTC